MPKGIPGWKAPRVGLVLGLEIRDELIEAVREAVAQGGPGLTFGAVADLFGLSYHYAHSAVQELAIIGDVALAHRADSNVRHIVLPGWEPPPRPELTAKQQAALDYLISVMDEDGVAYAAYKDIAEAGAAIGHGVSVCLDALDKKGFLSFLLRGRGARRTLFQVYPEGNGPREYSPFYHGMIEAPAHLGLPLPAGFAEWAPGKMVADGCEKFGRVAKVIRRWFREAGIEPVPVKREVIPRPERFAEWADGKSLKDAIAFYKRSAGVVGRWFAEVGIRPESGPDPVLAYPFLARDRGTPEHVLLKKVNAAVPTWLPPDRRADICQDLLVAILCGDIEEELLEMSAKDFIRRVIRQHPTQFGDLSLDQKIGDTDLRIMDSIEAEPTHWDFA